MPLAAGQYMMVLSLPGYAISTGSTQRIFQLWQPNCQILSTEPLRGTGVEQLGGADVTVGDRGLFSHTLFGDLGTT